MHPPLYVVRCFTNYHDGGCLYSKSRVRLSFHALRWSLMGPFGARF